MLSPRQATRFHFRRTHGKTKFVLALLASSVLLISSSPAFAAPHLTIDFSGLGTAGQAEVGDSVTLSIVANEIPVGMDSAGLFGFGFDLTFDDSIVSTSPASAGPLWDGTGFANSSATTSSVGLSANRFFEFDGPSGDEILLATIELTAMTVGVSTLNLTWFTGGPGDNALFDGTALDGSSSFFVGGSLTVIPEPSTGLLTGLGLLGLSKFARSRHFVA